MFGKYSKTGKFGNRQFQAKWLVATCKKNNSFFRHLVFAVPQLHPLQTQMESQQQYLPRDFIPKIDTKPKQKDIQCTHVHAWRHRYSMTMPNVIVADATEEEKQTVLEEMLKFK